MPLICSLNTGIRKTCVNKRDIVDIADRLRTKPRRIKKKLACEKSKTLDECLVSTDVINRKDFKDIFNRIYAPVQPRDKRGFLSMKGITQFWRQREQRHPNFSYIGTVNIDYMRYDNPVKYLRSLLKRKKASSYPGYRVTRHVRNHVGDSRKTHLEGQCWGVIFNTDIHGNKGKHWIALWIDVKRKFITFFDSLAKMRPRSVYRLICDINRFYGSQFIITSFSDEAIQTQKFTCGYHCINFLLRKLTDPIATAHTDTGVIKLKRFFNTRVYRNLC